MKDLILTHYIVQKDYSSGLHLQITNGKEVAWDNLAKKEEAVPQHTWIYMKFDHRKRIIP